MDKESKAERARRLNRESFKRWYDKLSDDKLKRREYDKKKYQKAKESGYKSNKEWSKKNPHIAQASSHNTAIRTKYPELYETTDIVTKDLSAWLKENRGKPCPYCGSPSVHIDHITPLARTGTHTWDNIELICGTCNYAKRAMLKDEFLDWIKKVVSYQGYMK